MYRPIYTRTKNKYKQKKNKNIRKTNKSICKQTSIYMYEREETRRDENILTQRKKTCVYEKQTSRDEKKQV